VTSNNRKRVEGLTTIAADVIRKIPGANAGIENILRHCQVLTPIMN
jgi:hypothetical protein